jgi:uncharacterized cofD-like protein
METLSRTFTGLFRRMDFRPWLMLVVLGGVTLGYALARIDIAGEQNTSLTFGLVGLGLVVLGALGVGRASFGSAGRGMGLVDLMREARLSGGVKVVAIGGGTGLPSALRALKQQTSNITAVVTVADDGGSSGRLRRDMKVLPPGDLRNNIAALADDESLMTKLMQYRFDSGELSGHAFGNLFISALSGVAGGLTEALGEIERVLNVRGRVLPATLDDVTLVAEMRVNGRHLRVEGESKIPEVGGTIEHVTLVPEPAAHPESVRAIMDAQLVVIGPGSLYTSILPSMMVGGIADALRATKAYKIYICNVATQPGETEGYSAADHVLALEQHIGRGVFQAVLVNTHYPEKNAGPNTRYVAPPPAHHEIYQRYEVREADLTDDARPWRHDGEKLAKAIKELLVVHRIGGGLV